MKIYITIIGVLAATIILLSSSKYLPHIQLLISRNTFTNELLKYQILALLVALLSMLLTLHFSPQSKSLLTFGNTKIIAVKEKWLGINGSSTWKQNAIQLAFFISLATAVFMFFAVKYTGSLSNFQWSFMPIVLLISISNSFSEEMIYRFAINGNLMSASSKLTLILISSVLFGIPHYFGFPSGIIGVIMSATLGYILSKATYETQGIGIAWLIHFLQDVIIFTAVMMMNIKE